jgi:hypothetical protein
VGLLTGVNMNKKEDGKRNKFLISTLLVKGSHVKIILFRFAGLNWNKII